MKNIPTQISNGVIYGIALVVIIGLIIAPSWSIYNQEIFKVKDENTFTVLEEIKILVKNSKTNSFNNLKDFNILYNKKINPSVPGCYYLKSFNNNGWYVFASRLSSRKYKKEYWQDYFIYISSDDYIINDEEMRNIDRVIKLPCGW